MRVALASFAVVFILASASPALADLVVTPSRVTAPPKSAQAFTAGGGFEPYVFDFDAAPSSGTVSRSGDYTAGAIGNVDDIIRVTDSHGTTATMRIHVGPGVTVTPPWASLAPGARVAFHADGGNGVYVWSLTEAPSGGSIDANGNYVAGTNSDADDVVELTDALGNTTQATVHVGVTIASNPAGAATTTPAGGRNELNLAGGADADNRCAVRGVGAPASSFGAAALALALAFSLTRRRRG